MALHFASVNKYMGPGLARAARARVGSSHVILRFFNYYMFMGTVINYSEKKGKKKIEQIL